jgi:hypothetical protein
LFLDAQQPKDDQTADEEHGPYEDPQQRGSVEVRCRSTDPPGEEQERSEPSNDARYVSHERQGTAEALSGIDETTVFPPDPTKTAEHVLAKANRQKTSEPPH